MTTIRTAIRAVVLGLVLGLLAACGGAPTSTTLVRPVALEDYQVAAVCGTDPALTGGPVIRVDDDACPAGDVVVPGHPYRWYYEDVRDRHDHADVVFVGQPLVTTVYVRERPPYVSSSLAVVRGFPRDQVAAAATCGCANPTVASLPQRSAPRAAAAAPTRPPATTAAAKPAAPTSRAPSPEVKRGGLGLPDQRVAQPVTRQQAAVAGSTGSTPRPAPPASPSVRTASPPKAGKR